MSVSKATKEDIFDVVLLAKKFLKEFKSPIRLDPEFFKDNLTASLDNPNFFLYVLKDSDDEVVGFLAGAKSNTMFSKQPSAIEIGWYVEPENRKSVGSLKLVNAFEAWAKASGCDIVSMGDLNTLKNLGPLYERKGYELYERTYIKKVS